MEDKDYEIIRQKLYRKVPEDKELIDALMYHIKRREDNLTHIESGTLHFKSRFYDGVKIVDINTYYFYRNGHKKVVRL